MNAEVKSSDSSPNDKATTSIDNLSIKDEYVRMACATLQTDNTLERVDDYGNKVSDSNKYYNTYISIKRSPPSGFDTSNISWKNYVKPGNVPTCSDDSKKSKHMMKMYIHRSYIESQQQQQHIIVKLSL